MAKLSRKKRKLRELIERRERAKHPAVRNPATIISVAQRLRELGVNDSVNASINRNRGIFAVLGVVPTFNETAVLEKFKRVSEIPPLTQELIDDVISKIKNCK